MIAFVSPTRIVERDLHLRLSLLDPRVGSSVFVDNVIDVGDREPQEYARDKFRGKVCRDGLHVIDGIPDLSSPFMIRRSNLV